MIHKLNYVRVARIALAVAALAAMSGRAMAQEYCVACAEPQATYRCQITGGTGPQSGQQLACIKAMAAEGQHASCSVRQPIPGQMCAGEIRQVAAATVPPLAAAPPAPLDQRPKGTEPETVEEALRKMTSSAQKQMDKTNDQLKRGAETTTSVVQRTFSCITSLFSRCGTE